MEPACAMVNMTNVAMSVAVSWRLLRVMSVLAPMWVVLPSGPHRPAANGI